MNKQYKRTISALLCILLAAGLCLSAFAADVPGGQTLRFGGDGIFRILHITDTHLHDDNVAASVRLIALACDTEQPDLVVLTGDLTPEDTFEHTAQMTDALMQVFETRKIPVAVTFGNHDSENGAYTRESVMALYNACDCSVSVDDGAALTGCGTYYLPILSSESGEERFRIWLFDSGDYDGEGHYGSVAEDQVAWYKRESAEAEARNGKKIPSLAFQHIIVPQVYEALEKCAHRTAFSYPHMYEKRDYYRFAPGNTNYGMLHETPCCGYYDHGQFDAMVERGDVLAIFTGHDHTNAFGVRYKGIDIVNSLSTRFNGDAFSTQYGYRVIDLHEDAPDSYTTRVERWYDFVNRKEVRALADGRKDAGLLRTVRFSGFFQKAFNEVGVWVVETFTGRTVRYPD